MEIIYAQEEFPKMVKKSIFLAGPTPRNELTESWRKNALDILEKLGYDGTVYIPEPEDKAFYDNYDNQIEWEHAAMDAADVIVFWIPRDLSVDERNNLRMPAFTTNVEFGLYISSGKVSIGFPDGTEHINYLQHLADERNISTFNTLKDTLKNALKIIGDGAIRIDGEVKVPLLIWNNKEFQHWYRMQRSVGNELRNLKTDYVFLMPKEKQLFLWICNVSVYIRNEDRIKDIEFVLSRTNLSTVVLYCWPENKLLEDTEIVLIKEFRSPVNNKECMVYELPGGSSLDVNENMLDVAYHEVSEETGIELPKERMEVIHCRQAVATLSAHHIYAYKMELNEDEMERVKELIGTSHGNQNETECTYLEVMKVKDILNSELVDWTNVGIILEALIAPF